MEKRRFLKVEDIAQELEVSETTVRSWIREGKIRAGRAGRDYRIPVEEYERFLKEFFYPNEPPEKK
jgi:excisionase family DNA binding protein